MAARVGWRTLGIGIAVLAIHAALVPLRPIDGDEGIYLNAYQEILRGRLLYVDFCYFQYPTLPYLGAAWQAVTGPSPVGLRALSLVCAAGTLLLLAGWGRRRGLPDGMVAALCGAWGLSALSVAWMVTIKSYAVSVLLSVAAFVLIARGERARWNRAWVPLGAGALLGLAATTRLFYAFCVPAAMAWMALGLRRIGRRETLRGAGLFAVGAALGLAPNYVVMAVDWQAFWFHTVTIHALRNETNRTIADWGQKGAILADLALRAQACILLAGPVWGIWTRRLLADGGREELLAAIWAATLGVVSLLPTPTFTQYFVTTVPFLVIASRPLLERVAASPRRRAWATAGALVYLCALPYEAYEKEIGTMGGWGPETIAQWHEISRVIEALTPPTDPVLAWWPGLATVAHRENVRGMENNFAHMFSDKLTADQKTRYHAADAEALRSLLRAGRPGTVVLRRAFFFPDRAAWAPLVMERYDLARVVGDFEIWARRRAPAPAP